MVSKNNFKVLLIYPPVWMSDAPYLSVPALTAYLKEHGINVIQKDLNIEFWTFFYRRSQIVDIYRRIQDAWEKLGNIKHLTEYESALQIVIAAVKGLSEGRFVSEVKRGVIDRELYHKLVHGVSEFNIDRARAYQLKANNEIQGYHDLFFSDISCSMYAHSKKTLIDILNNPVENPFWNYFKRNSLNSIIKIRPQIIGLSIIAINQVVPVFTLAKLIKTYLPHIHIVIGGPWCTQVHEKLGTNLNSFEFIDSMIIYEGEEPLLKLCSAIQKGYELDDIPNLYFKSGNSVIKNHKLFAIDMNKLPSPNFNGLPLDKYAAPNSLPLQSSKGCYHAKCTFCSYPVIEPTYKTRNISKVSEDIKLLQTKYNARIISFADAIISPSYARKLSKSILSSGLKIEWLIFARLEKGFTPALLELMAKSGCVSISWGLESGNERILKIIEKQLEIHSAARILSDAKKSGINNRVLVMYGLPSETKEEALQTIDFIKRHFAQIDSISYNYYHPEKNTPIEEMCSKYQLNLSFNKKNDLSFKYHLTSHISEADKKEIQNQYNRLSEQLLLRDKFLFKENALSSIKLLLRKNDTPNRFHIDLPNSGKVKREILSTVVTLSSCKKRIYFEISSV